MVTGVIACLGIIFASHAEADSLRLFLCTEDSSGESMNKKLVYGYIGGEKTGCMPEQELLELYNRKEFERQRDSLLEERKKTDDYYIEAIKHGKKNLRDANLRMADLMGARLKDVDLRHADLSNADLRNAAFTGADLRDANLSIAYCKDADFSNAKLERADLTGAYCNGADFSNASGLTVEMLVKTRTLHEAALDSSLLASVRAEAPEKLEKPAEGWIDNQWAPPPDSAKAE